MARKNQTKSPLRTILKATLLVILIVLIHVAHALTLDRIIEYREVTFTSERVPAGMEGYRIAFVVDTHGISETRLQSVVDELNERQVDLLLLGGDFARSEGEPQRSIGLLSQVQTTDGIFGVAGNHDRYWELFAAMETHGMTPLSNSGAYIREGFYLAGVEDLWRRNPDIATAMAGAAADSFVLLVTHNPDVTMQEDTAQIDLILSGHSHGGQMTLFGLWTPVLRLRGITAYGHRFLSGWAESRDGAPVYVSNGVGEYVPRVFARPQVILITLE